MPGTSAEKDAALRRLVQRLRANAGRRDASCRLQLRFDRRRCRCERRIADARASERSDSRRHVALDRRLLRSRRRPAVAWQRLFHRPTLDGRRSSAAISRVRCGAKVDPIGKRFKQISPAPPVPRDLVVTGVYDSRHLPSGMATARVYRSVKEWPARRYLIRTAGPAADLADTVRRIAREELPTTPIDPPITLAQIDEERGERDPHGAARGIQRRDARLAARVDWPLRHRRALGGTTAARDRRPHGARRPRRSGGRSLL